MFYRMIQNARDQWLLSCPVNGILRYMRERGKLRDAQIDAIQTWLFLKIGCDSRPLADLFCEGAFNTLSLDDAPLSAPVRAYLSGNPAAAALYEYAALSGGDDQRVSKALERQRAAGGRLRTIFQERFLWRLLYGLSFQSAHGRGQDVFNGRVSLSGTVFRV